MTKKKELFLKSSLNEKNIFSILQNLLKSEDPKDLFKDALKNLIDVLIYSIDKCISSQVNAIIHFPHFQQLEASWRGINYLVNHSSQENTVKIRLLNVSWSELSEDVLNSIEFDQSQLFKKIYEEEFGMPGGEPYGLLIGDYDLNTALPSSGGDDILTLAAISQIMAVAFSPFIMGISPQFFDLENFSELKLVKDIENVFKSIKYKRWNNFQKEQESRFIGIVLPKILMRRPYRSYNTYIDQIQFEEDILLPNKKSYLWGNASYAFAGVVINSFLESGWFSVITGTFKTNDINGGLVKSLPREEYETDRWGLLAKPSLDVFIGPMLERQLSELGFLPLCVLKNKNLAAFYSCSSAQQPKTYNKNIANVNAELSTKLNYLLCVSRIVHYIKVIYRQKIGSFSSSDHIENYLRHWLLKYTANNRDLTSKTILKYPLRSSQIIVKEIPSHPGYYKCIVQLQLQYQPDQIEINILLER